MKIIINSFDNYTDCFNQMVDELHAHGIEVPDDITADDLIISEGFSFDEVCASFYEEEDGAFAYIEFPDSPDSAEAPHLSREIIAEEIEEVCIEEVCIIVRCNTTRYAIISYSDGSQVKVYKADNDIIRFIRKMILFNHFETIFGTMSSCIKFGSSFRNADTDDVVEVDNNLVVRIVDFFNEMPFARFNEGIWYHPTGALVLDYKGYVAEFKKFGA